MNKFNLIIACIFFISFLSTAQKSAIYLDPDQPLDVRVKDLISKMTLEEKVSQMINNSPAIPRLNIPEYDWWNECLHGVARSGVATVFPQSIGLGATFDPDLMFRIGTAISDEARAMYNAAISKGYHMKYGGLTFWTPNVNIFRDPRWGRGQETYGEDPFLTSSLAVAYVKGLQGDNPAYLKVAACAKHFAVHSGPEKLRHEFNAQASLKDMNETYLPAFKALVGAGVEIVMCAYNRTNDEPCCANNYLLNEMLRKKWGFKGHVVTDCWALPDFYLGHKVTDNPVEASAMALKHGVNLECGNTFNPYLLDALKQGLLTEKDIDNAFVPLIRTRFKLGLFDPPEMNPYNSISQDVINNEAHRKLAKEAALKSVVLLKNDGILPLKKDLGMYFVTGPNATSLDILLGNYHGVNGNMVTIFEGIALKISTGSQMHYQPGCQLDRYNVNPINWITGEARKADATIVVLGLSGLLEGEEGESIASPYNGDKPDYNLPENQIDFLRKLREGNMKPIIVIVTGGGPMNLAEIHELADAVLLVWYPGEEGGNAIADIIFGDVSPSGKLPVTFPKSLDQLLPFEDYSMTGRTYRYMEAEPMYPFGFGLSYTKFDYSGLRLSANKVKKNQVINTEVTVKNSGTRIGEEVIQLYLSDLTASVKVPLFSLKDFKRITLNPGDSMVVKFTITPDMMAIINENGESVIEPGDFKVLIGGSLPGKRSEELGMPKHVEDIFTVK